MNFCSGFLMTSEKYIVYNEYKKGQEISYDKSDITGSA